MPKQAWTQGLASMRGQGTNFTAYTTAKTVINQEALYPIGANTLALGDAYRVTVTGGITNPASTPGTVTFQVMLGTIAVWTSGAVQMNATIHTTLPFWLDVELVLQLNNTTVGGTVAKFMGVGRLHGVMFGKAAAQTDLWGRVSAADASASDTTLMVPATAPALGAAFDATISQTFDFFVGFSSATSTGIQIATYRLDGTN